jgi:hypothetical protein
MDGSSRCRKDPQLLDNKPAKAATTKAKTIRKFDGGGIGGTSIIERHFK